MGKVEYEALMNMIPETQLGYSLSWGLDGVTIRDPDGKVVVIAKSFEGALAYLREVVIPKRKGSQE